MSLAESAIFLGLDPLRMRLLILRSIIVPLLALCAGQCDSCTHIVSPPRGFSLYSGTKQVFLAHKKKTCHNLESKSNISGAISQYVSCINNSVRSPAESEPGTGLHRFRDKQHNISFSGLFIPAFSPAGSSPELLRPALL